MVSSLASRPRLAAGGARPALSTALAPLGRAVPCARGCRGRRVARVGSGTSAAAAAAELGLDESKGLLAVLGAVALVGGCVVARAAVRVGRVAVVLELGGRGAGVAGRAGIEAISSAGSHIVGETSPVTGVTHHDDGLDLVKGAGVDTRGAGGDTSTAVRSTADGIVHDLTTLRISDKNNLGVGAASIETVDSRGNGVGALSGGIAVLDAAARGLATTGWVDDGLGGGTWIGLEDEVDNDASGTKSGGDRGLTSTEDVNGGT